MKLYLDLETYNEYPLKGGVARYVEDPSLEITLCAYAIDDGPVQVWDVTTGASMPAQLQDGLEDTRVPVVIHNSYFDRTVMTAAEFFDLCPSRIIDTMVQAYCHNLPGGLDKLSKLFKLADDKAKMKEGRALMLLFCKPHKDVRYTRESHPEKWAKFVEYASRDVTAMRIIHEMMPQWNYPGRNFPAEPSSEHRLWCIDQRINDRGFAVDVALATAAVEASAFEKDYLDSRTLALTDGEVAAATQRDKLLVHVLKAYGIALPDMKADTLKRRIEDESLPLELRQLLDLRMQSSRNSASKYKTVLAAVNHDNRIRGCIQFAGAPATGRMAGRIIQPQNFMRPTMKGEAVNEAIELVKSGAATLVYDNLPEVLGNCTRGIIVAGEGKKLIAADLKSIEGRGLAWLAGDQHVVDFYHGFDAGLIKYDSYMLAYAMCFGVKPEDVDKKMRQIGKPIDLGCFAEDTQVLTSTGVKKITAVQLSDKLWDGETWVAHEGLVDQGVKPVVSVDGIEATPDHLINTQGTWEPVGQLVSNPSILRRALATGAESLRSLASSTDLPAVYTSSLLLARAEQPLTVSTVTTFAKDQAPAVTTVQRQKAATPKSSTGDMPVSSPMRNTGGACSIEYPLAFTAATMSTAGSARVTVSVGLKSLLRGAKALQGAVFSWLTSSLYRVGISLSWSSTGKTTIADTNPATCVLSANARTTKTGAPSKACSSKSTNSKPVFDIANAGPRNRFTILSDSGALVVHNCGYGGGVAAFITFALVYNLDLDDVAERIWATGDRAHLHECAAKWEWAKEHGYHAGMGERKYAAFEYVKQKWRAARPMTVKFWKDLAEGFKQATLYADKTFLAGRIKFYRQGQWLRLRLPSGRNLNFLQPQVDKDGISFMGSDRYTRQWTRTYTHGGKLSGLVTQAFASDVLRASMEPIEDAGFDIVLTVHDETVVEASPDRTVKELADLMTRPIPWAPGLPLAADGFSAARYKKDD
jgi:hypothetical protein